MSSLGNIYTIHHRSGNRLGFSVMEKDRGELLRLLVGGGKTVLDIGCRDGNLTKYFSEKNDVLGVDIDESALAKAHARLGIKTQVADLNGDWSQLGINKFDIVVAGEVLEHLYYPSAVVEKVAKCLRQKGVFVGSVPNAFSLINRFRYLLGTKKHTPLQDPTHINQFSFEEIKSVLEEKFVFVKIIGLGRLGFLVKIFPGWFAFDLFFVCSGVRAETNSESEI